MTWIALTVWAAFAQTVRNAAQRSLVGELGTLGATLVRFVYGLPFAALWLGTVAVATGLPLPSAGMAFAGWLVLGSVMQISGTALLLRTMEERNFAVGVAYSKSEVLQVALFSFVLAGDRLTPVAALAVAIGTAGVLLLTPADPAHPWRSLLSGLGSRSALLGLACGGSFALSAVAFRAAMRTLPTPSFLLAAACTLLGAQALQTLLLGTWLHRRAPGTLTRVAKAWRASLFAGFMGAAASVGWFSAFALQPVTYVRTLGLVEILFGYVASRRVFREHPSRREVAGMALLVAGVIAIAFA
ncbi:MAG: DMT family transporter [Burkholderiales bacterium]